MWGCLAKVEIPKPKKVKIGPKTIDCVFIGYAQNSAAYRFLVHKSEIDNIHESTVIELRNARFFEHIFPLKQGTHKRPREDEISNSLEDIEDNLQQISAD